MNSYEIRTGKYIKEAWDLFVKAPEVFVVSSLVYFAVFLTLGRLPIIGGIFNLILASFFFPALYLAADYVKKEGKGSFDVMKNSLNFAPQVAIQSLVIGTFITIGFVLFIIPGIYLTVAYAFSTQMIVFRGKNFWEAMEASRKLVNKNWFGIFGLSITGCIITFSGLLFFGIGILVTMPLAFLIFYCALQDISAQTNL